MRPQLEGPGPLTPQPWPIPFLRDAHFSLVIIDLKMVINGEKGQTGGADRASPSFIVMRTGLSPALPAAGKDICIRFLG